MADDNTGFSLDLNSLRRIGRVVREVEMNAPLPQEPLRRPKFTGRTVEGVFLEDLDGTNDPNVPGYARFQIKTSLQGLAGWADQNSPSIIPVWNRSPNAAVAGDFGYAKELYPNKWFWLSGGAGGTQIINFQITSSDPSTRTALVQIEQRSFLGTVYGSFSEDSSVYVYDTDGCYLNEINVDLTARRGKAVLMYTDAAAEALHFPEGYPPARYWCVLSICCPSLECE